MIRRQKHKRKLGVDRNRKDGRLTVERERHREKGGLEVHKRKPRKR